MSDAPIIHPLQELKQVADDLLALHEVAAPNPRAKKAPPLGDEIDRAYRYKQAITLANKLVDMCKAQYRAMEEHIVNDFTKQEIGGARGHLSQMSVASEEVPTVEDWDALYPYIAEHKAWDLLHRRLGSRAVLERWADGKTVPGIGKTSVLKVTLTKLRGKK